MKKLVFLLFLLVFRVSGVNATVKSTDSTKHQTPKGTLYGLFASWNVNYHSADLRGMPDYVDFVPRYVTGRSNGFSIGAFYEIPFTQRASLIVRGLFNHDKADIAGDAPYGTIIKAKYGTYNYYHRITSNLTGVRIEPLFHYYLIGKFGIFAGANLGLSFKKSSEHQEYIKSGTNNPDSLYVPYANHWSDESIGLQAAITGGIGYDFSLSGNGKYLIGLEALYSYGFSDIVGNLAFDINTIRLGMSLKYSTYEAKKSAKSVKPLPPPFVEPPMPEPPPKEPVLVKPIELPVIKSISRKPDTLLLSVKKIDGSSEADIDNVKIEEFFSTDIQPLLNYIFFDENNTKLPSRYKLLDGSETKTFTTGKLYGLDAISTYHNILNVIGRRMNDNPDIKITLVGCNSGKGEEKGNTELSGGRAKTVAEYLINIWNISTERIKTEAQNLPQNFSKNIEDDGIEENRRVEIYSSNKELFAPVTSFDTLRMAHPDAIRFYPKLSTEALVTGYDLTLKVTPISNPISIFSSTEAAKLPEYFDWNLKENSAFLSRLDVSPIWELKVLLNDTADKSSRVVNSEPIVFKVNISRINKKESQLKDGKKAEQFSLILFDYDEHKLTEENKAILKKVASRIAPNSEIEIEGFTDRLGDETHNIHLSEARATTVSKALQALIKVDLPVSGKGMGETVLYDNNLPEGRFYNRTVKITVITPEKK